MIRLMYFDTTTKQLQDNELIHLEQRIADERYWLWLDLPAMPMLDEKELLYDRLGLSLAAVKGFQCLTGPIIEERSGHVLLRIHEPSALATTLTFTPQPLGFFFTQRFLITRHEQPSACVDTLWSELLDLDPIRLNPALLAIRLIGMLTARYLTLLSDLEARLETAVTPTTNDEVMILDQVRQALSEHCALFTQIDALEVSLSDEVRSHLLTLESILQQALAIAKCYSQTYGSAA